MAILIEVKYANDGSVHLACKKALKQVEERKYDEELRKRSRENLKIWNCLLHETMQGKVIRLALYKK